MRVAVGTFAVLATALALASCGSRAGLDPENRACGTQGAIRACENTCGTGSRFCRDGVWGPCEVAPVTLPCVNICGEGLQVCEDGVLHACDVAPSQQPCANDCGEGQQLCENGSLGACVVPPVVVACMSVCGTGVETCIDGVARACDAPQPLPPQLRTVIRDFSDQHPDFELPLSGTIDDRGIVRDQLGMDDKPIYASSSVTLTTTGRANFEQWFNEPPTAFVDLALTRSPDFPGLFVYRNNSFFPIDNQGIGNEGRNHNFHFTLETSFRFRYVGGEVFRFEGDDDLWVFVNRRLAIDLGGLHASEKGEVELDRVAADFGLVRGEVYPLHLFFAERHTTQSNFSVETTIADPGSCP